MEFGIASLQLFLKNEAGRHEYSIKMQIYQN